MLLQVIVKFNNIANMRKCHCRNSMHYTQYMERKSQDFDTVQDGHECVNFICMQEHR